MNFDSVLVFFRDHTDTLPSANAVRQSSLDLDDRTHTKKTENEKPYTIESRTYVYTSLLCRFSIDLLHLRIKLRIYVYSRVR